MDVYSIFYAVESKTIWLRRLIFMDNKTKILVMRVLKTIFYLLGFLSLIHI